MNKKIIIGIVAVVLLAAGAFFWMNSKKEVDPTQKVSEHAEDEKWNPYSETDAHIVTLSDMILSASNGKYIVKMTNTIKFSNEETFYKFQGFDSVEEAKKASEEGGHGGDDEHVTPMEIKINDTISELMLRANETQILDKKILKAYLLEGINRELNIKEKYITDLFIENYVIQ